MPKAPPPSVSFRKPQAGRPFSEAASTQAQGPRALQGAMSIPIEQIAPDPDQPRRAMDDEGLRELAASLTMYGVLQPLLVRDDGYLDDERTRYRIIAGGRRYAAALLAGLARLPVVVRATEGATLRVTQLIENVQRQDLAPLEEARAFQELMDAEGIGAEELGKRLHVSGQYVRTRLQLLSDQIIADAVERAQIPPTVAREIIRLPDTEEKAEVRAQVQAGQRVTHSDLQGIKDRHVAAGVTNPRAKGGGRPSHKAKEARPNSGKDRVGSPTRRPQDQPLVDTPSSLQGATPPQDSDSNLLALMVGALDIAALDALLVYGEERAWSCAELARAVRALQPERKGN